MDEELKKLLTENLAKSEEIYQTNLKIKKYLVISQVLSALRILVVVIPVILAVIYLPTILKDFFSVYTDLFDSVSRLN